MLIPRYLVVILVLNVVIVVSRYILERRQTKKRISAISGASGFVGSVLAERLREAIAIGRDGYVPDGIDVVFDLAAYGNLASQRTDAKEIYQANLFRVIESFEHINHDTDFIYVSSSSVARPIQNLYSASKKAGEDFVRLKAEEGFRTAIVRPYAITGPGDQDEHLIPTLIRSCINGESMPFVPDPVHDYFDVRDFVDALLVIADKGQLNGEIYEVGSGKQVTNREVLNVVEKVTGRKANLRLVDSMRSYDSKEWRSNNERISTLGWKPKFSLEQTITDMVDKYK